MKKKVIGVGIAIILIVLLLFLTGCGNEIENNEESVENSINTINEQKQESIIKNGIYNMTLTDEDICYLEEVYVPHALVGVMVQNTLENAKQNMYGQ